MSPVEGKYIQLKAYNTDGYYLFACVQEVILTQTVELLYTTSPASGLFRTKKTRLSDWKLSVRGIFFLTSAIETRWLTLDLFDSTVRENGLQIQIEFKDQDGIIKTFEGHVFIPSTSITGTTGSLAKWQLEMEGSGDYTIS